MNSDDPLLPDGAVEESVGDEISALARQRRAAAKTEIESSPPEFIIGVEHSEVHLVFRPVAMPLTQVNLRSLREQLKETYGVSLSAPDLAPLLDIMTTERLAALTVEEATATLLRETRNPVLSFADGRFTVDSENFVEIRKISINRESILVAVGGKSRVAELVAADAMEAVWASAGTAKPWKKISEHQLIANYATGTRIRLPIKFEHILHDVVLEFFEREVIGGPGFGRFMAGLSKRNDFKPASTVETVLTLDEVHLYFHNFDRQTGKSTRSKLLLQVTSLDEYGTGLIVVHSELPYDQHVELLEGLLADLGVLASTPSTNVGQ